MLSNQHGMPDARLTLLRELKAEGATKVTLHPDGSIASVEFGPDAAQPHHDDQHENPVVVTPKRRPTGQLVPRDESERRST